MNIYTRATVKSEQGIAAEYHDMEIVGPQIQIRLDLMNGVWLDIDEAKRLHYELEGALRDAWENEQANNQPVPYSLA